MSDDLPPGLRIALAVTNYRLCIEQATALLKMGRAQAALDVLLDQAAPARQASYGGKQVRRRTRPPIPDRSCGEWLRIRPSDLVTLARARHLALNDQVAP